MRARSYRWLRSRVLGLISVPPIGFRETSDGKRTRSDPLWGTRIQSAIYATKGGSTT